MGTKVCFLYKDKESKLAYYSSFGQPEKETEKYCSQQVINQHSFLDAELTAVQTSFLAPLTEIVLWVVYSMIGGQLFNRKLLKVPSLHRYNF